jgi:uncharacterized protein YbjT (DUF2867 family)
MKVAVAAAAGNIGAAVVDRLVEQGHEVTAMVRKPESQPSRPGVHHARVVLPGADDVEAACRGVDALLWVTPPDLSVQSLQTWYRDCAAAACQAVERNGIDRVVHVSAVGAGSGEGLGTVTFTGNTEQALNRVASNVVHLRPGYFMENLLLQAGGIVDDGIVRLPYAADHDIPWIAVGDIADAAVRYLTDGHWAGQWERNLLGPANLDGLQLARVLSHALGRPVRYEQVPLSVQRSQLESFGLAPVVIDELMELFVCLGDPAGVYAAPRTREAVTRTTVDEFARRLLMR